MKKILVIRFSSLGDVILTTAIHPNLKAKWPECEITVLTKATYANVYDNNPHVDHVRIFDPSRQSFSQLANEIRDEKFDVIIDLQANMRSWFLRLLAGAPQTVVVKKQSLQRRMLIWFKWRSPSLALSVRERILECLAPLDVPVVHQETQLFPKKRDAVIQTYSLNSWKNLIGLAPGAQHNTKRWGAARFAECANRLGAIPDTMVIIFGDKNDRAVADKVHSLVKVPCLNLSGWTSFPDLFALISKLSLLVTNDSGLMHAGEALKVPLVALFGPTVRSFGFAPYRETSRVAEVINLPCRPCTLHGQDVCPLKHHKCMEDIEVDAVLYVASSLLEKPGQLASSS